MPSTTYPEFGHDTEASEVAKGFAGNIQGKTILITGASLKSIGFETAKAFASQSPANLILCGRTVSNIEKSIAALKEQYPNVAYHALPVDLGSQSSVRAAAVTVLGWTSIPKLDIMINCAGVMGLPERTLTPEGIEMHFATNHIGHFLLTCLLAPKLIAAGPGARVVSVSSGSPMMAKMRWSDPFFTKPAGSLPEEEQPSAMLIQAFGAPENWRELEYIPIEGYNQSKVANVLFAIGLTKRLFEKHGVLSVAVHPGVAKSELGRAYSKDMKAAVDKLMDGKGMFVWQSRESAAATSLVAALDPALAVGVGVKVDGKQENYGAYLADCQITEKAQPLAVSSSEAERMWKFSEELVKEKFEW